MDGYMIEAEFADDVLTVRGKNKAARVALAGADHGAGDIVITRQDIASAELKPARLGGTINGNLTVTTTQGKRYQLHFRKKQQPGFEELARLLSV